MSLNLRIDTSADPDQRLALLLAQQAELQARNVHLQAEIASLQSSSGPTSTYRNQHSSVQKHHHRRSNVPRSISSGAAPTISRHLSSDRNEAAAISKSLSQRSAPSMARTNSRGSASRRSSKIPFTSNGSSRQIPPPTETRRESPAMAAWTTYEQPLSSYTFSHQQPQPLQRSSSQRKSELDRVPEHSHVLEDPSNYISRTFGAVITPLLSNSPPLPTPSSTQTLSNGSESFHVPTPSTPSTEALTSATTLTNNSMSRTDSLFNEGLPESMQMLRFNSNASYSNISHVDQSYDHVPPTFSSRPIRRSSNEEQSQLLVGTGGASHVSQFSHSLPVHLASSASFGEKMEKSVSSSSNSSSSTSSSRSKQVLRVQNQLAASRPLMPKGGCDGDELRRNNSSSSTCRLDSKDGSLDKVAISKPAYQRPKHDRVYCKKCDIHPAGFRGEHELRRHQDRDHKRVVKKWICVDPTGDGHHHPKPVMALSKCKACSQQKKYGAYYNAAAHLRRTHFKPKTSKGRSKGGKDLDEKRGGKAGGDWPPMTDLKYWMKEVEEEAPDYGLTESQQDEADASDEEIDASLDDELASHCKMSTTTSSHCFDTDFFGDAPPVFDTYQPIITTDMYTLQFPLDTPSQCMDETMFTDSSQTFSDFSSNVLMNDPLAFTDVNFSQTFDDQALMAGPDLKYFSY